MTNKVGLVLSGGGAKGAYHVGVMQAIQEMDMTIDAIAGASIGALNGAILSSAPNLKTGIDHMKEIWQLLPEQQPIRFKSNNIKFALPSINDKLGYLTLLLSAGLRLSYPFSIILNATNFMEIESLVEDSVLHDLMQKYLDLDCLQHSIPLYVSVFAQHHQGKAIQDFLMGLKDLFKTEVLGVNNQLSEFRHIQSLAKEEQKELILASAALPLLFKAYQDQQGKRFTDGGQGGMLNAQGNTPIEPLIQAGCQNVIVVHLNGASLWHRHDFANTSIIEIRPSIDLGDGRATLDFSQTTINQLIKLGYDDAKQTLTKVVSSLSSLYNLRASTAQLNQVFDDNTSKKLDNAMQRLRNLK